MGQNYKYCINNVKVKIKTMTILSLDEAWSLHYSELFHKFQ